MHLLEDINVAIWLLGNSPLELDDDLEVYFLGYGPYIWLAEQFADVPLRDSTLRDTELETLLADGYDVTLSDLIADLRELWVVPLEPGENVPTGIAVVGREAWTEEELVDLLRIHAGSKIRVYSEEMFVAYLLTGLDPFDSDQDLLRSFGVGHPALEFLMDLEVGFDWPTTIVSPRFGRGQEPEYDWSKDSPAGILGYRVGKSSPLSDGERRRILERTMSMHFGPMMYERLGREYLEPWGEPNSNERLYKLVQWLAAMCRRERLRQMSTGQSLEVAIQQRESDLAWLKHKYYHDRFRFEWPSTDVHTY